MEITELLIIVIVVAVVIAIYRIIDKKMGP